MQQLLYDPCLEMGYVTGGRPSTRDGVAQARQQNTVLYPRVGLKHEQHGTLWGFRVRSRPMFTHWFTSEHPTDLAGFRNRR